MIIAQFGHRLVRAYNAERGTALNARAFFDEEVFPVLFDDEHFLLNAGNTLIGQWDSISVKKDPSKRIPLTLERRREMLLRFHDNVAEADPTGNDVMLGGVALEVSAATSGLLTDLRNPLVSDDVYASWIGAALALVVQGGWGVLVEDDRVLLDTFDGWRAYRRFLKETPGVKSRQLPTWNAHWLGNAASDDPRAVPFTVETAMEADQSAVPTLGWPQLLFGLARGLNGPRTAYVFKLGQMNSTLGFVRLDLPAISGMSAWYSRLFANEAGQPWRELAALYDTHYRFDEACRDGTLGLRQLEPSGLRVYLSSRSGKKPRQPDPDSTPLPYPLYLTWIVAMLEHDGKDLHERAQEAAQLLLTYEAGALGGKVNRQRDVEAALTPEYGRYHEFVDGLRKLVETEESLYEPLDALLRASARLSEDQFRLFLALLRFHVAGRRRKLPEASA